MTEGPWVDLPACFTTQGRWVESAIPNSSMERQRPCIGETNGPPTHRLDLTEEPWVDSPACFTTQGRWVESALRNPSTARQRPCVGGTNGPTTQRLDMTVGPWVDLPACFTTQGRGSRLLYRVLPRLGTAVCRRNERPANHRLDLTKDLGCTSRLLHDARSVGRERSPNPSTARQRPCVGGTNGPPTHRLDLTEGPLVDRPGCFTTQGRWVESALPNPSTTRRRPCVCGTNDSPTHRLDLTEGPWSDLPACFTTQGRWVEIALPNPSTARQRPCVGGTTGPPTHRLDLTEGPWWTVPLASRRKVGGSKALYRILHDTATAVCRGTNVRQPTA
ncbi:hypothetical protein TNCT_624421 [Trichonephila clavata]|uniref:Uncharacterized protein n=1 Tax=Trichonephila clavata TaxID=2740835 RepID=A0A8X6KSL2_TRICU|nr:hypothetical protein TNCT_624421 [Trichonephila clavata]